MIIIIILCKIEGHGEVMEMFGLCRVQVNDDLKVCKIKVFSYYDLFKKLDRFYNVNHFCTGKIV